MCWCSQSPFCASNTPPAAVNITQQAAVAITATVAARSFLLHVPDTACQKAMIISIEAGMPSHHSNQPTSQMITGNMR